MKKRKTTTLRLKAIGRTTLLTVASIALCVFGTFQVGEELINKLDSSLIKHYVSHYDDDYDAAKFQIENRDSVALLKTLLHKLQETQRGDRLANIKERSLDLVTAFYIKKSQFNKALYWAEIWSQFDERNLTASVRLYSIQYKIPKLRNTAISGLEKLRKKVPESELVSRTSILWALEEHRHRDALNAAKMYFERTYNSYDLPWLVYWDTGTGFKDSQSLSLSPSIGLTRELFLETKLPSNIVRLRFDPPPLSKFLIKKPVWGWGQGKPNEKSVLNEKLGMNDIKLNSNSLETNGGPDPHFFWQVPRHYSDNHRLTYFKAGLEKTVPYWFEEIITHLGKPHEKNFTALISDPELADFVLKLTNPKTLISVYWSDEEKHFSEERTLQKTVLIRKNGRFKAAYPIGETVRKIRVDFPASLNAKVKITRIGVTRDGVEELIDLVKAKYLLMNNISRKGLDFSLEGKDPHFAIEIEEGLIEAVYLDGEIH